MSYVFSKALQGDGTEKKKKLSLSDRQNTLPSRVPPPVAAKPRLSRSLSTESEEPPKTAEPTKPEGDSNFESRKTSLDAAKSRRKSSQPATNDDGEIKMGGAFSRLVRKVSVDDNKSEKISLYTDKYEAYKMQKSMKAHGVPPPQMKGGVRKYSQDNNPATPAAPTEARRQSTSSITSVPEESTPNSAPPPVAPSPTESAVVNGPSADAGGIKMGASFQRLQRRVSVDDETLGEDSVFEKKQRSQSSSSQGSADGGGNGGAEDVSEIGRSFLEQILDGYNTEMNEPIVVEQTLLTPDKLIVIDEQETSAMRDEKERMMLSQQQGRDTLLAAIEDLDNFNIDETCQDIGKAAGVKPEAPAQDNRIEEAHHESDTSTEMNHFEENYQTTDLTAGSSPNHDEPVHGLVASADLLDLSGPVCLADAFQSIGYSPNKAVHEIAKEGTPERSQASNAVNAGSGGKEWKMNNVNGELEVSYS